MVINPSRLAARGTALTAEQELEINTGKAAAGKEAQAAQAGVSDAVTKPVMTHDQLQRGLGISPREVPAGVDDLVPHDAIKYRDASGQEVSFGKVMERMGDFMAAASGMAKIMGAAPNVNPIEAAIAYKRNAGGKKQEQSLAALETDLVKMSVMGFQIGTARDRAMMDALDGLCGTLTKGLDRNRNLHGTTSTFELGIRRLPEGIPYLAIAGVRESIHWIYNELEFNEEVIQFLKHELPSTKGWTEEQWNYLRNFKDEVKKLKITGLHDGSIYVGGPIMRVEGPPMIAEFIESAVMARVSSMTARATAVAMVKEVFGGKFSELGMRRPPSADSMTKDIEGCNVVADVPTSLVAAQYLKNVQAIGTMEHSAILLNGTDAETLFFVQWFLMYGKASAALVDSRTPKEGVEAVIKAQQIINKLRPTLEKDPAYSHITTWEIPAIRLDSGDLQPQVIEFRKMLDDAGMKSTEIFIMDGMDHEKLKKIIFTKDGKEVRVDSTGAGETIRFPVTTKDNGEKYNWQSAIGMIYKAGRLIEADGEAIDMAKLSATPDKATFPPRTLFRQYDADGKIAGDVAGYLRADGSYEVPAAPEGGRVEERLSVLAENGQPHADFDLPQGEYWQKSRARHAEEKKGLGSDWRERDAKRAAGDKNWRPFALTNSDELKESLLKIAREANREEEFAKHLGTTKKA